MSMAKKQFLREDHNVIVIFALYGLGEYITKETEIKNFLDNKIISNEKYMALFSKELKQLIENALIYIMKFSKQIITANLYTGE